MANSYALQKRGYKHKYINRRTFTFEAILYGAAISMATATLGVVTIFSPNFAKTNDLVKREKIKLYDTEKLSEDDIAYYVNKAKDYYLYTDEGRLEIASGRAFIDYDFDDSEFLANEIEETYEEKIIKKYCAIYQVDYEIVYKKIADLTDNFTSVEYINGTIPGITLKKEPVNFANPETLLLAAVRCCKQTPAFLGLSCIDIEDPYVTDENILDQISYYSELFQVDKKMVYAILRSECSFGSDFTDATNNLPSIKFDGKFAKFDNITQSIIELCTEIYKFNKQGLYTVDEIGPSYAPIEDNNENWIPNVKASYSEAERVFRENGVFANSKL